jgi:hypothetical protein
VGASPVGGEASGSVAAITRGGALLAWLRPGSNQPSNKEMKLTKPERIGASQLISRVGRTLVGRA